jgi:hypothetical protein
MSSDSSRILLSNQWTAVPGIESFSQRSLLLPENATARACFEHAALIRSKDEAVSFVTRLPKLKDAPPVDTRAKEIPVPEPTPPTHVLLDSTAYALTTPCFLQGGGGEVTYQLQLQSESQCTLGMQGGKPQLQILGDASIWLNDQALSAGDPVPALGAGDSLRLAAGGAPVQLIRVNPDVQA